MHSRELGRQVAEALLTELLGCRVLRQVWDDIDPDIRYEIRTELIVAAEAKIREERDLKLYDFAHTWTAAADKRPADEAAAALRVCAESVEAILVDK